MVVIQVYTTVLGESMHKLTPLELVEAAFPQLLCLQRIPHIRIWQEVMLMEVECKRNSSPSEPFLGMRFDTLKAAKAHYSAYAGNIGFSVKSHQSKKKAHTNELEKQQFVCNKFRRPKTE
jgi:hypothetical protein